MEQNLTINIEKPCTEKFKNFKTTKSGGFCVSCKKDVIDFRKMSDKALIQYFKNKKGKTCGYFNESQLKTYKVKESNNSPASFKFLRVAALTVFTLTSLHNIQAQNGNPIEIVDQDKKMKRNNISQENEQDRLLKGIISDGAHPLPGVNIILKGTSVGIATDFDGEFEFPQRVKEGDILQISYLGYVTQEIKIKKEQTKLNAILTINMKEDVSCVLMGEVAINESYKSKRSLWQKFKNIF